MLAIVKLNRSSFVCKPHGSGQIKDLGTGPLFVSITGTQMTMHNRSVVELGVSERTEKRTQEARKKLWGEMEVTPLAEASAASVLSCKGVPASAAPIISEEEIGLLDDTPLRAIVAELLIMRHEVRALRDVIVSIDGREVHASLSPTASAIHDSIVESGDGGSRYGAVFTSASCWNVAQPHRRDWTMESPELAARRLCTS